ncbi:MAG: peroxidase family protein [Rhodomicrobiaceae bacterium]
MLKDLTPPAGARSADSDAYPKPYRPSFAGRLMVTAFEKLNTRVPWYRLPRYLGLANLAAIRISLREKNLFHAGPREEPLPDPDASGEAEGDEERHSYRSIDGRFNDLRCPAMGACRTRFGRNVPLSEGQAEPLDQICSPSPRLVSQRLMARREFVPATSLNLLAAAWIQFQIHDWFNHGDNEETNSFLFPLGPDDPWEENPMRIRRTGSDGRSEEEKLAGLPPAFLSTESHWWDASAIYGSDPALHPELLGQEGGQMLIHGGLLPLAPGDPMPLTGFNDNWWIGLEMLHTLFVHEHNAICAALHEQYPQWSDLRLFNTARLINAALIAKIHTVEWTPAILAHPTMKLAMRANWWGLAGERVKRMFGFSGNETLFGIPGSPTEHHGVPYSLTEEFVSVYRMHQLMPDEIAFHALDGEHVRTLPLPEIIEEKARRLMADRGEAIFGRPLGMADMFYSFGIAHPGALRLHNFPNFLRKHTLPEGVTVDLAAIDVLRDRERGVPRYNRMRRLLRMPGAQSFADITDNPEWAEEMREVYEDDVERVDLQVGMLAEPLIEGFGFSETALRIFILMASRRLKSDRFFTADFRPEIYTQLGMDWIADNDMRSVLLRHHPQLKPALAASDNAFAPWRRAGR